MSLTDRSNSPQFRMVPVVERHGMHDFDEENDDLLYWLSRPPNERIAAVTFLISQMLTNGERMDKSYVRKRRLRRR